MVAAVLVCAVGVSYATAGSTSPDAAGAAQVQTITLRGRPGIDGPWRTRLSLKLRRGGVPTSFTLCAIIDRRVFPPPCLPKAGVKLPEGARLRLEARRGTK